MRTRAMVVKTFFLVAGFVNGVAPVGLAAGAAPGEVLAKTSPAELEGRWVRVDSAGDAGWIVGEYPGMTLEIEVAEEGLRIRQAVGAVRDGEALPGSGEKHLEFLLRLDGREREVPGPRGIDRLARAEWSDGALHVRFRYLFPGEGDDVPSLVVEESWSVPDADPDTLVVRRILRWEGREPERERIVYRRVG